MSTLWFNCPVNFLLAHHPYYDFERRAYYYFKDYPYVTNSVLRVYIYFFFCLAIYGLIILGLLTNDLIRSKGKVNSPAPPKSDNKNQPPKDIHTNMYITTYIFYFLEPL